MFIVTGHNTSAGEWKLQKEIDGIGVETGVFAQARGEDEVVSVGGVAIEHWWSHKG